MAGTQKIGTRLETHPSCPGCGYDLHGLTVNRCPECGRPFEWTNPAAVSTRWVIPEPLAGVCRAALGLVVMTFGTLIITVATSLAYFFVFRAQMPMSGDFPPIPAAALAGFVVGTFRWLRPIEQLGSSLAAEALLFILVRQIVGELDADYLAGFNTHLILPWLVAALAGHYLPSRLTTLRKRVAR